MQNAKSCICQTEMLPDVETLLREKIGLDATTIGKSAIALAVRRCMEECGLADMQTYLTRLQTSPKEFEELIENVIVPETWFFRGRETFAFLSRYVSLEWLPNNPGRVLRVLSVPSSTGEEPYSIAIALMEAGLASKNFCIDAVDISKKSLLKAQRAVYDKNSFRGGNLAFQERYFEQTADGYRLCEWVRRTVNFIHGNLLAPSFVLYKLPYDVIFCRNLLIYFDSAAREQTIQVLNRLLTQKGLLFVGHSETGQLFASRFVPVRQPLVFAYTKAENSNNQKSNGTKIGRKADVKKSSSELSVSSTPQTFNLVPFGQTSLLKDQRQWTKENRTASFVPPISVPYTGGVAQLTTDSGRTMLEIARNSADRGRLNEAAMLCETYLNQNRLSAEAYVLLGEVRQAAGNEEQAEQCFDKAIYLEPNHYEALVHLALLKEHRGDFARAAILRQRIQRLQKFPGK